MARADKDRKGMFIAGQTLCPSATVLQYGPSCGGFVDGPWPPIPGTPHYPVRLHKAAPEQVAVLMVGARKANFDMGFFGLKGCHLLVNEGLASYASKVNSKGVAEVRFAIPASMTGELYCQWMFVNPKAKGPIPVSLSNALQLSVR